MPTDERQAVVAKMAHRSIAVAPSTNHQALFGASGQRELFLNSDNRYNYCYWKSRLVAYSAALERRFTRKGIVGSTPTSSADT